MNASSPSQKVTWYWNRLRCMSWREINYRLRNVVISRIQQQGMLTAGEVPCADFTRDGINWLPLDECSFKSDYCKAADQVIRGNLTVFVLDDLFIGYPPEWNRNPLSGHLAPLTFGKSLDYRNEGIVGDIKYLWEPSRHLHIVTLAQAYWVSSDKKYLHALKTQVLSWIDQCPYMKGPHWTSSLELGIRLINWSIAWQIIGGADSKIFEGEEGVSFRQKWLTSIYQHMHFINGFYSGFSSGNNHLIGEAAGLFIATLTWPYWTESQRWNKKAKGILEREALLQNDAEGVNREQTTSYVQFVLDFLLLAGLAGSANHVDFSAEYWARIESMMEFLMSITDVAGHVPMIGDADDGLVVNLSLQENSCPYRSLVAIGAILFDRDDFNAAGTFTDDKLQWLLGGADSVPDTNSKKLEDRVSGQNQYGRVPIKRAFKESGYYIIGCDFNTDKEIKAVVDAGPLGYQEIAAHGHADALSITLSYKGNEFLIDPGTYSYHTKKMWREYFRGTTAHNTICVDDVSQSESGGNFMWLHKARAWCETWAVSDSRDYFVGAHDGYQRLSDPVIHRREIVFDKQQKRLTVLDYLQCTGEHQVHAHWHFSELCTITPLNNQFIVNNGTGQLRISCENSDINAQLYRGDEQLPLGWVSRRYDDKSESSTLRYSKKINGSFLLKTTFHFE